ncbi:hypothetical protein BR93DRAFT_957764 [Coniochaeta sp. PMI_546]|nr:hypothetical protein BR93DRAFT_957764 [Coniochaeta sp. PMI_546]
MYAPQFSTLLLLLGGVAATAVPSDEHFSSLLARQAPGTPKYECHFNCGSAISGGRLEGHCDNTTWVGYYQECLDCALEFDIWQYYGTGVSTAAAACGLSATPSPAESATPSTSTSVDVPATVSTTSDEATSDAVSATTTVESTSAADSSATDTPTTPVTSASAPETTTTPAPTGAGSNSTSTATTSSATSHQTFVTVSGALRTQVTGSLLGVGAMVAFGLKALW